jgi:hypothetical protein
VDLDSAADQLYGLAPAEFTAARDRLAAEARSAGDRELAAAVKKLKRPTVAAWLANLLVRERGEEVDRLVALGRQLREAQEQLDAGELRRLSQQRHQVAAGLVAQARQLAGQPTSESVARDLQETLEAAMSDPQAVEALSSGRLTVAISYSGLGFGDPGEVVAVARSTRPTQSPGSAGGQARSAGGQARSTDGPARSARGQARSAGGQARSTRPAGTARAARPVTDQGSDRVESEEKAEREERERREAELRDARAAATDARRALDQLSRRTRQLARAADQRERRLADLRRQVDEAEDDHRHARAEAAEAERALAGAEADVARAVERVQKAEAALG